MIKQTINVIPKMERETIGIPKYGKRNQKNNEVQKM